MQLDRRKQIIRTEHYEEISDKFQTHPSSDSQTESDPDVFYSIIHNQHVAAKKYVNHTWKSDFV